MPANWTPSQTHVSGAVCRVRFTANAKLVEANRGSLDVLIHKDLHHLTDHTMDIEWLGNSQNLKLEIFEHLTGGE